MIDPTIHQIFELHAPYRFELQRIFLKSQAGYTALILSINSSLNKESPPVWDLLLDSVGIQKRKLLKSLSLAILGEPTGIFWHTPLNSSRPMNSAELLEWLDTGFGSAVTVEELLAVNPGVKCTAGLSVHDNERVEYQILSTKDLDD